MAWKFSLLTCLRSSLDILPSLSMSYTLNTTIERERERKRERETERERDRERERERVTNQVPYKLAIHSQSSFFSLVFISCSWPLDSLLNRASVLTNWRKLMDSTEILESRLHTNIQCTRQWCCSSDSKCPLRGEGNPKGGQKHPLN